MLLVGKNRPGFIWLCSGYIYIYGGKEYRHYVPPLPTRCASTCASRAGYGAAGESRNIEEKTERNHETHETHEKRYKKVQGSKPFYSFNPE
jgi:hypothetical protein